MTEKIANTLLRAMADSVRESTEMLSGVERGFSGLSEDAMNRRVTNNLTPRQILENLKRDRDEWTAALNWLRDTIARARAVRQRKNIDSLLEAYYTELEKYSSKHAGPYACEHVMKMIEQMFKMEDPVKLNRWFGFVQGMMFSLDLRTIEQLRDETRGAVHAEFAGWPAGAI